MWKGKRMTTAVFMMILAVGLVLSGCSGSNSGNTDAASSPSNTAEAGSTSTPAQTESAQPSKSLEPVQLTWYIRSAEPKNAAAVMQKANEIIKSEINATLEFKYINPGDYEAKMQLVMSSGEEYDLAFTASWANSYFNNVSKGAYIPLDDLLAQYPSITGMFNQQVWDALKVNGKIYGIPNNQIMADQPGLWMRKDLVDKYKIDVANIKSIDDLTAALQTIQSGEPGVSAIRGGIATTAFMDYIPTVEGFAVDTQTWKVYDLQEALLDNYKVMRDWYKKGFFPQDVATLKDENSLIKAGKVFSRYSRQTPGGEQVTKANFGFDVVNLVTGPSVITKAGVTSTLKAISATSKNPERAMMLINLIDTNKELYNLLKFGIEGQDYVKSGSEHAEPKAGEYALAGWMFGNEFNSYLLPGQPDDLWAQTKQLNDSAVVDPLIGFSFDRTTVENEIAQLNATHKEFSPILSNGLDEVDKVFPMMQEKRKASGMDKVMAEIQRQLDEWRKTQ